MSDKPNMDQAEAERELVELPKIPVAFREIAEEEGTEAAYHTMLLDMLDIEEADGGTCWGQIYSEVSGLWIRSVTSIRHDDDGTPWREVCRLLNIDNGSNAWVLLEAIRQDKAMYGSIESEYLQSQRKLERLKDLELAISRVKWLLGIYSQSTYSDTAAKLLGKLILKEIDNAENGYIPF